MWIRYSLILFATCSACGKATNATPVSPSSTKSEPEMVSSPSATNPNVVASAASPPATAQSNVKSIPLPGASGPVTLDYLAYDRSHARVWVPVGDTGSVDVFDTAKSTFHRVDGFKTVEREMRGKKRMMGPSSAAVGDGFVYVGNRATSEVCAVDASSLQLGPCLKLTTPPDGVAFVASSKEVWVTTPKDQTLTVLDASNPRTLKSKLVIKLPGAPEGYAIDNARGLFYTNLEDKNRTLVLDINTHTIKATWAPGCGDDGPRGVAVDGTHNFVIVACTESVRTLDGAHEGAPLGKLETGAGVDNIEYSDATKLLYIAAGKAARLTIARMDDNGQPSVVTTTSTAEGARNAVADAAGNVYIADPQGARLLILQR